MPTRSRDRRVTLLQCALSWGAGTDLESILKQRLVGAIVLVALAVIFLPMLLDGSGRSGPRDVAIDIPERPESPPNRLEQSNDPATDGAEASPSGDSNPSVGARSQPATMTDERSDGDTLVQQPSSASDEPASSEQAQDEPDAEVAEGPAEEDEATDSSAASEPAAGDSTGDGAEAGSESWVVQVGSFSRETNALVLRDRLRELGFDTFVERAGSGDGAVWRVRVGPVSSEDEAQRLSEQVTEQRGGPALVMTQP